MSKKFLSIVAAGALAFAANAGAQSKNEPVKFALCYDLTKAYTWVVPLYAQAARDYAQIVNAQGGIEGHPVELLIQDTGNEPQRGIECYEKTKREGAITFDFASTIVSRALLPRVLKDHQIMIQPYNGRSDAVDGEVYPWVFPIGPNYWSQLANDIQYIKNKSNGNLKGIKIAFVYVDHPFGHEQLPLLKLLAERDGFVLQQFPYPLPGNDQAAAWSEVRRFNPDWILNWGYAAQHVTAAREMTRNGIPMDKYIATNWINEVDIANIGNDRAKGLKRSANVAGGANSPLIQQVLKDLYDKGKGAGERNRVADVYYNMGLGIYSTVFEATRLAIRQSGWPLTPDKMKRGLESVRDFDANGMLAPVTITAKDHGGGGKTRIDMWDGTKWVPQSGWFSAYEDVVWGIAKKESAQFAKSLQ